MTLRTLKKKEDKNVQKIIDKLRNSPYFYSTKLDVLSTSDKVEREDKIVNFLSTEGIKFNDSLRLDDLVNALEKVFTEDSEPTLEQKVNELIRRQDLIVQELESLRDECHSLNSEVSISDHVVNWSRYLRKL